MLEIYAIRLVEEAVFIKFKNHLISKLPLNIATKFSDYKHSDSLQRSLLGELLLRKIVSQKLKMNGKDIVFQIGDKGKPYLPNQNMYFNISHSGQWVLGAFSDKEVGIDVELIREPNYEVAKRFYSDIEIANLNAISDPELKKDYFFTLWTLKESYLKAIGTGLTKSLSSFTVITSNGQIELVDGLPIDTIFFKQYNFDKDYKLAVCSFENKFCEDIQLIDILSF
ncbi:MAG: 4'-phosphopantetheinyl transferase family protein [Bacteroidales bacterium]